MYIFGLLCQLLLMPGCVFTRRQQYEALNIPNVRRAVSELNEGRLVIRILLDRQPGSLVATWNDVHPAFDPDGGKTRSVTVTRQSAHSYLITVELKDLPDRRVYLRIFWTSSTSGYMDETYFSVLGNKVVRLFI